MWVALYGIPIARSHHKNLYFYRSWKAFLERKLDSIWSNERWARNCWLRPSEGAFLDYPEEKHCKDLRSLFKGPIIYLAGIYRQPYDICWVRAPANVQFKGGFNDYYIYQICLTNYFFIVKGLRYKDISNGIEVPSGLPLGVWSPDQEGWTYIFEVFSEPNLVSYKKLAT